MQQDAKEMPARLVRSRQGACDSLWSFLESASPRTAVITGAAGMGKTFVLDRLAALRPARYPFLRLDGNPSWTPANLTDHLAVSLGLPPKGSARTFGEIGGFLADEAEDDRHWVLAIDEAHTLRFQTLDALRVLTNRLGQPGMFWALILSGRTRLKQRLTVVGNRDWSSRPMLATHIPPIDAEEAADLVAGSWPGRAIHEDRVEHWHAEGWGVPARILDLASRELSLPIPLPPPKPETLPPAVMPTTTAKEVSLHTVPLLGGDPRPIRIEGDAVEVGWGLDEDVTILEEEAPIAFPAAAVAAPSASPPAVELEEESVRDPYALIQASQEWGVNQMHFAALAPAPSALDDADTEPEVEEDDPPAEEWGTARVRREGAQEFAPYSQLFSRARPSR